MGKARTNLSTALTGSGVRDNFNAPFLSTSSFSHWLGPKSSCQAMPCSGGVRQREGSPGGCLLGPASWLGMLSWSSAAWGCKLNCDKYTENCIAWRLESMLACAQTKLFFTCTSFKRSHFKGTACFMVSIHCFFLPEENYQNNKSSVEEILLCLVISWEKFFYLYNMQIFLWHVGNRNWLLLHWRCECKKSMGLGFFLSRLTLQTKLVNRNVCIKFFIRFRT